MRTTDTTTREYQVRNNLHKFIKRWRKRLVDLFQDKSLRDDVAICIMEEIRSLYDDIITDRLTIWQIEEIIFLADITDEIEFAKAFYDYLAEAETDKFGRSYNKMYLEMGIDYVYQV